MSLNVPNLSGNIPSGESFLEETMVSFREVTPDKTQNLVKNAIPLPVSETPGKLSADVVHVLDTRIVAPQTQTVSNFTLDRNEDSKYIPPARAPQPSSYYSSQTSSYTDSRGTSDLRGAPIPPADTIEVTHKFDIELPAKYPISPPTITLPEGTVRSDKHAANDEKVAEMQKEIDRLRDEVLSANRRLEELNSQLTTKDALAKGFMTRIEGLEKDLHTRDMDWRHEKQCAMELRERLLQSDRRLESDRSHHEELLKKKSHEIEKLKRMNQILDNDRLELEVKLMQLKQREDKERTPSGSGMSTKQGAGSSPRSSMKQEPSSPTGSLSKPFIPEPASPLSRTQSLRQFSQETSAPPSRTQSSKNLQRESSLSSNQSNSKTSFQRETSSPPSRTQSSKALREASSSQPPTSAKRDVTCRTPSTKSCSETSAIVEDLTQQVHAMEVLRQQRATLENEVAVLKQHLIEARQRMLCLRPLEEECVELRQQIEQKNMRLNDYERKSTALNEQLHSQCEKHDQTLENLKLHQELLHRSTFLAITLAPLENGVYDGNRIHYHAPTQPLTVKETENVLNALESEMSKRPGSVQVHPRRGTPQLTATHLAPTTAARLWPPKRSTRSEAGGSNAVTPGTRSPRSGSGEYGSPSAVVPDSLIPGISSDAAVGNGALQLHLPSPYQIFASTTNRTYNLPRKGAILLGAAEDCDIEVPGKYVDPYHAIIICTPHSVPCIADLGARKGTYVNGQRVGIPVRLHPGTRFTVGNIAHTFCVQFVGSDSVIQLSPLDVSSNLPNTTRTSSLSGASQGTLQAYRRYTSDASLRSSQQPTPYSSHMNPVPVSKNGSAIQTERTLVVALRGPANVYRTRVVRPKSSGLGRISSRSVPLRTSRVTRSVQPNDKATSTSRSRSTAAIAAMNRVPASRYPSTANRGIRSSSQHISVS